MIIIIGSYLMVGNAIIILHLSKVLIFQHSLGFFSLAIQ